MDIYPILCEFVVVTPEVLKSSSYSTVLWFPLYLGAYAVSPMDSMDATDV